MTGPAARSPATTTRRHVLVLLVLCAITYFPGLDRHGVTNWQEAQRLVVARQMQDRYRSALAGGDRHAVLEALLVPTSNGTPYIAKPPMIYWSQLALAGLMGERIELWHLRLVVALAGVMGVLAAYWTTLQILAPDRLGPTLGPGGVVLDETLIRSAAFWAGATLATGLLYARSARIGELDILLAPFCTLAIGAIARAWRRHRELRDTDLVAVLSALIGTCLAALTKDPGVMVVGLSAYAGIALWAAAVGAGTPVDVALARGRARAPLVPVPVATGPAGAIPIVLAGLFTAAGMAASSRQVGAAIDVLGVGVIGAAMGGVGWTLGRLFEPVRFRAMLVALSRTHPLLVIGGAVLVRLAWGWAAGSIIGPDQLARLTQSEVEDNVRLFVAEAPLNNLQAAAFGVGVGSVAAIVGLVWLLRDRPRVPASWWQLFSWIAFTLLAFSVLGKGVQRYLTPAWPAVSILAGLTIAALLRDIRLRRPLLSALVIAVAMLSVGQGWWYGYGRDRSSADRSPRNLVAELRRTRAGAMGRMMSVEFSHPALEYYLDRRVVPVGDARVNVSMAGGTGVTFDQLAQAVRMRGPVYAFIRTGTIPGVDAPPALERLAAMGLRIEPVTTRSVFRIDAGKSEVRCYRLSWPRPDRSPASDSP